jgi:hypothetical protein
MSIDRPGKRSILDMRRQLATLKGAMGQFSPDQYEADNFLTIAARNISIRGLSVLVAYGNMDGILSTPIATFFRDHVE